MKKQFPEPLMNQSLEALEISKKLKATAEMNGFFTLGDIARLSTAELEKCIGFNLHLIFEYVNYMESKGLGKYIDPE